MTNLILLDFYLSYFLFRIRSPDCKRWFARTGTHRGDRLFVPSLILTNEKRDARNAVKTKEIVLRNFHVDFHEEYAACFYLQILSFFFYKDSVFSFPKRTLKRRLIDFIPLSESNNSCQNQNCGSDISDYFIE